MARILVCGGPQLANRLLTERLVAKLRIDGHDADVCASPADAAHCDGLVALMDAGGSAPVAALATARAVGKPVLALSSTGLAPGLAGLGCTEQLLRSDADLTAGLALFYDSVRPHAGRVVRDDVPRLVHEAGHHLTFREAARDERAHLLKRKVVEEARELDAAVGGAEKEEAADLLEALEAFLRDRGYDRDELKAIKEAKRKRRGGFERCLVVEATPASASALAHEAGVGATTPTVA